MFLISELLKLDIFMAFSFSLLLISRGKREKIAKINKTKSAIYCPDENKRIRWLKLLQISFLHLLPVHFSSQMFQAVKFPTSIKLSFLNMIYSHKTISQIFAGMSLFNGIKKFNFKCESLSISEIFFEEINQFQSLKNKI